MSRFGKWIGGGLGWAFGGPIGALFGFLIGTVVDNTTVTSSTFTNTQNSQRTMRGDFNVSLIVLIAAVLKSDGKVVKSELEYVKNFFVNQFGQPYAGEATIMLRDILKQDIPLRDVCSQIADHMDYSSRLQLLHLLFNISLSDSDLQEEEKKIIGQISGYLGISDTDYKSIKNMFVPETDSAYKILEIEKNVSDEEVKKAYRRMAMKYHPDKVSHLGEDYKKNAEEKFKKVKEAYDTIKKERNMV